MLKTSQKKEAKPKKAKGSRLLALENKCFYATLGTSAEGSLEKESGYNIT